MPKAENYKHLPTEFIPISWKARSNIADLGSGRILGEEYHLNLEIAVHPNKSGKIIINYPGLLGSREGFKNKYQKLAQYMQGEGLGAVIRAHGPGFPSFAGFTDDVLLRRVLTYALENTLNICGTKNPEIFMVGTSAGAGAVAASAAESENVKKILLIAPGANIGLKALIKGLKLFKGEVCIVIGEDDENVGASNGQYFYDFASGASYRKIFFIPNCDHQFTGKTNGKILSRAPFYAFAEGKRPNFPDPENGIILY